MRRDFRAELAAEPCWDQQVEAVFARRGEPLVDAILQNREELIALCEWIEARSIRSYLEIGLWTGRLLCTLQRLFRFERVAACDDGWVRRHGLPMRLPAAVDYFEGDSTSTAAQAWRRQLGHIDLVFIDANHHYRGVQRDFALQRQQPHRFLVLHDISGARRQTAGVARLWSEIVDGHRREICLPHAELGIPSTTMGIGIWSADEQP